MTNSNFLACWFTDATPVYDAHMTKHGEWSTNHGTRARTSKSLVKNISRAELIGLRNLSKGKKLHCRIQRSSPVWKATMAHSCQNSISAVVLDSWWHPRLSVLTPRKASCLSIISTATGRFNFLHPILIIMGAQNDIIGYLFLRYETIRVDYKEKSIEPFFKKHVAIKSTDNIYAKINRISCREYLALMVVQNVYLPSDIKHSHRYLYKKWNFIIFTQAANVLI